MGRAGAGGYATVQHAYDTRLKRDVAIKCIKITKADIERSRISIHNAQIENASMALGARGERRALRGAGEDGSLSQEVQSGFVPLSAKISEPGFLSSREKYAERRAKRHTFLKEGRDGGAGALKGYQQTNLGDTEDLDDEEEAPSEPFDLSDFADYSNFKSRGRSGRGGAAGKASTKHAASKQHRRDLDSLSVNSGDTVGLREFAEGIPGRISGAGEADISGIGELSIALPKIPQLSDEREGAKTPSVEEDSCDLYEEDEDSADVQVRAHNPRSRKGADRPKARRPFLEDAIEELSAEPVMAEPGDPIARMERIPGLEEARTAAHLNDANIVTVYDCVVEGDMAYVIMEYVEGKTLARIMRDLGNDITLDIVASVFNSVSHALEVAHKAGILHLDIKPENVIVNADGVAKVTDFGLSTLMDASGQGETGGGTIGYMPLEQMRQQRLDVRTDEWALASLTYEMLSGKNPFKARSLADAEAAIEGAELVIPSLCWESIDESVDDIMFDALSPDMEGRYPDIKSFADDLSPLLGDAREGRTQLAQAVKDADALHEKPEREKRPPKPYVPFIDKLGMRGSNILMRAFSAMGAAMLAVIALMNFRMEFGGHTTAQTSAGGSQSIEAASGTMFGLFSSVPVAAWIVLAAVVAVAVIWPRFSMPAAYALFVVTMFFNQAFLPALLLLAGTGAWWWLYGRNNDMMCTLAMMQPLLGSIGFAAVVPVLAGALLDVKDAVLTTAMVALSALVMAAFGSCNVMDWEVMSNFIVAVNPSIAGVSISSGFVQTLGSLQNWVVIASWIGAAALYSLICRKGTHVFDILASVAAAVLVIAGILVVPIATGDFSGLTPLTISGAIVASLIGVVFALLNIPDRVRLAPGEW